MNSDSTRIKILELEQYFITKLKPNLNVCQLVGSNLVNRSPMSEEIKNKLRKKRGRVIYVYDLSILSLIFISDSKQLLIQNIKISDYFLNKYLKNGKLYLNRFLFSNKKLELLEFISIINKNNYNNLLNLYLSNTNF
jgi:hypothetical protein